MPKADVDPIYRVIKKLKKKYQLEHTLIVGHSGGAAITGILSGRFPKLIDEAILISCPCVVPHGEKIILIKFQKTLTVNIVLLFLNPIHPMNMWKN